MPGYNYFDAILIYFGLEPEDRDEKYTYLIDNSKVYSILKGHVTLSHPIKSFKEGNIPRNSYHNTMAFRMSIPLVRKENPMYANPQAQEQQQQEGEKVYEEFDYVEENPENLDIMFVLKKGLQNEDKNKSVQELRQAEEIDLYYFNPLSQEDEEDDGIFFGKISEQEYVNAMKVLFKKVLDPRFSLNQNPLNGGGGFYQLTAQIFNADGQN